MKSGKPGVFISYARKDLQSAQNLEKIFQAEGIRVWRDQESIYAGEQWPKAIGQAIEKESIFLLLWSKHSTESHFVEFEWNTALALKKTIVPVLLDNTPLPAALRAINGVFFEDTGNTIKKLLEMLAVSPPSPHRQNPQVIHELSQVKEKSIKDVLNRVKTTYFLHESLEEKVRKTTAYKKAQARQLKILEKSLNLGTKGSITVSREELHER